MQASDIPSKFPIPFGADAGAGYIRVIPEASQVGIQNGAASLTDGFPPLNATPLSAGGVPPFMQDFNGLLKQITQWSQWQNAGATVTFDSGFATAIGGYPKGALLAAASNPGAYWSSLIDNNSNDPDAGGAGWTPVSASPTSRVITAAGPQNILSSDVNVFVAPTVPAAMTLMLPATPTPQEVTIIDDLGDAETYNISINGNGKLIGTAAGTTGLLPLNQNYQSITLVWRTGATQWRIKG